MKSNLRHPGNTIRMSDRWVDHRARGSLGGTDFVDAYGTPVHAALNGAYLSIVDNSPDGSGGRVCRVTGPDGDSVERLHHHAVTALRGQWVEAEDVVGISGASAFGSNYGTGGPHIHEHGISAGGVRFNLEPYYWFLTGGSTPASGSNATPIPKEWDDMATKDEFEAATYNGVKRALNEQPIPPKSLEVVFGAEFMSGDPAVAGIGQASEGNHFLVDHDADTYRWIVTVGKIRELEARYGTARRVDPAFFIGMRNAFSRDAIDKRPGQ